MFANLDLQGTSNLVSFILQTGEGSKTHPQAVPHLKNALGRAEPVKQKSVYAIPLKSGGLQFAYSLC